MEWTPCEGPDSYSGKSRGGWIAIDRDAVGEIFALDEVMQDKRFLPHPKVSETLKEHLYLLLPAT